MKVLHPSENALSPNFMALPIYSRLQALRVWPRDYGISCLYLRYFLSFKSGNLYICQILSVFRFLIFLMICIDLYSSSSQFYSNFYPINHKWSVSTVKPVLSMRSGDLTILHAMGRCMLSGGGQPWAIEGYYHGKKQNWGHIWFSKIFKLAIYQILLNAEPLRENLPPKTTFFMNFRVLTDFTGEMHIFDGVEWIPVRA